MSAALPVEMLRLPPAMKEDLMRAARANYRRPNAELLMRLQASFECESINEHGVIVSSRPAVTSDQTPGGHTCA
jgi:hypothetical protein